ncbi:MAG: hypothetical protein LBI99_09830 [Propionibacteriaceae bacterium]|jgi:hypothetical protein|nr:hypothetical protein [Propionibacteriaceae bacterium]
MAEAQPAGRSLERGEVMLSPRWHQVLGCVAGAALCLLGVVAACSGQALRLAWLILTAFPSFWAGVALLVTMWPVFRMRDRVGLRVGDAGLEARNTGFGRALGPIAWQQLSALKTDDGASIMVLELRDPAEWAERVPRHLETRIANGVPLSRRFLAISAQDFTALVTALARRNGVPATSDAGVRATGSDALAETSHGEVPVPRGCAAIPEECRLIKAVPRGYLFPFGIASRYLYLLTAFALFAAVSLLVLGARTEPGDGTVLWLSLAIVTLLLVNPGYGMVFLRPRSIMVTDGHMTVTTPFGRTRHLPLVGLENVELHEGTIGGIGPGEPIVSIMLRYAQDGQSSGPSTPRRVLLSGRGMPAKPMRALGIWLMSRRSQS